VSNFFQCYSWLTYFKGGFDGQSSMVHINLHSIYMTAAFLLLLFGGLGRLIFRSG
jgi:hypothetical protein